MEKLVIATRRSQLALWQSEYIKAELLKHYPNMEVELQEFTTKGDKILDTHLGSASIALAIDKANKADGMELDFVGIELDKDYFDSAMKRFSEGRQQMFLNLNVE